MRPCVGMCICVCACVCSVSVFMYIPNFIYVYSFIIEKKNTICCSLSECACVSRRDFEEKKQENIRILAYFYLHKRKTSHK